MGNHKLRKQLGKILKEKGYGRLYTCNKRHAYKWLPSHRLRSMIAFLTEVKPGMKVNEWGINQVVSEEPIPLWRDSKQGWSSMTYGGLYGEIDQVKYESGYLSCGCGAYACFAWNNEVRSKEEIVKSFKKGFEDKNWGPSFIAIEYFELLKQGIDILTDDGFLIPNYRELCDTIDSRSLVEEWRKKDVENYDKKAT